MLRELVTGTPAESRAVAIEGNRRLTAITALPLLILLAIEGYTVLAGVHPTIWLHVFVGMLLIPPVLLKLASVGYRFVRYYINTPAYREAGPPPLLLRALGPLVLISTVLLFFSGVALVCTRYGSSWAYNLHRYSFYAWLAFMALHVLAHIWRVSRVAAVEWARDRPAPGMTARLAAVSGSLAVGLVVAVVTMHFVTLGGR
jgi:hypothetical protein